MHSSIDGAIRDLRHAVRRLVRSPGFAIITATSLALGIGANTAIFSVIDALMLRSLPVDRPGDLVVIVRNYVGRGTADYVTYPEFERLRDAHVFADVTASMTIGRAPIRVDGAQADAGPATVGLVSGSYFATLGVHTAVGRTLVPDDDRAAGARPVAVLSEPYWRREFAAAPDVAGRTLAIGDTTFAIVGVAQPEFTGENVGDVTDVWVPIAMQSQIMPERPGLLTSAGSNWIRTIARLAPGASRAQTEASVRGVLGDFSAASPQYGPVRFDLEPAGRGFAAQREFFTVPLEALMAVVGIVLLIACANVATLLLARGASRQPELALRVALGASRAHLVRQLFAESAVITAIATASGMAVAIWLTRLLGALAASGRMALGVDVRPHARMFEVATVLGIVTVLLSGVLPAWRTATRSIASMIKGSESDGSRRRRLLRGGRSLVVAQVAASVVLTMAAGLFVRTLRNLEAQHVGFDRDHVWMFWMDPRQSGRERDALAPVFDDAQTRVSAVPGVVSASVTDTAVLSGFVGLRAVTVEGRAPAPDQDVNAQWTLVGPGFFDTIGMRRIAGRDFGPADTSTSPRVAIVNQTMARDFFGDVDPVGRRFSFGRELGQTIEIVGVVEDAKYFSARDADVRMVYLPYRQDIAHLFRMCVVVRTATDDPALVARLRATLEVVAPGVPVTRVDTTRDQFDRTISEERLTAWLSAGFGMLAVALACVGLYGVMAHAVIRRTREIGIRMALGESRFGVVRGVLRECLVLAAAGIAVGVPLGLVSTRGVQSLLFGVDATDPMTTAGAAALLAVVALLAGFVPARRAARVDPLVALRAD